MTSPLEPEKTYRTSFARAIAVLVGLVCVVAVVAGAFAGPGSLLRPGWVFGCMGIGAWLVFWRPYVQLSDGEIVMVNLLRSHRIPWVRVTEIDSRWAFTVRTSEGAYSAWAVPGSSGMAARARPTRRRDRGTSPDPDTERRLSGGHDADAVALAAAERMARLREAGYLAEPRDDIPVTSRWDRPALVAVVVGLVWAVAGVVA